LRALANGATRRAPARCASQQNERGRGETAMMAAATLWLLCLGLFLDLADAAPTLDEE
jgi:hypothetical protein